MSTPLRVLLAEDSESDAELVVRKLEQSGYDVSFERVDTADAFSAALSRQAWDVIIADYYMPGFDGLEALAIANESDLDLPFIIASGVIGEDVAVEAMQNGAYDYVMKDHLVRLGSAVERALREAEARRARKQAEKALRCSEERYALAQRVANVGSWDWDILTGDLHWSAQIEPLFGFGRGKFVATYEGFLQCVHPGDRQHIVDSVNACVNEGKDYDIEHRIVWPDGTVRWVSETGDVIRDGEGKAIRMLGIIQDITERKQAEGALSRERDLVRRIMETSPAGITLMDRKGQITFANARAEQVLGLTRDRIRERTYNDPSWHITDYDGNPFPDEELPFQRVVTTGHPVFDVRHAIEWPNGQRVLLSINTAPLFDEAGQVDVMVSTVEDITERVRSEEERTRAEEALAESESRLRSTLASMDDLVFVLDRQGRFTLCYAPLTELYKPPEEFMGKKHSEVMPPSVDKLSTEAFNKNRRGETAEYEYQLEVDGEVRWYSAKLSPMFLDDEFAGSVAVIRNVTERKQAEEALRRYAAELKARNEELDAFAHTAAHDLKNPLGLVIGYADVLAMDYLSLPPEDVERYVQAIARNGRRMGRIIDELLLLASVRQAEVEVEPLDMESIARESLQRLVDMIERHQAEIVMPETWPTALGYEPWVEEVWVNYLDNAIKYGGSPPRVELGAEVLPPAEDEEKGGMVRFWVRDNGQGLTPEEQERLFRPFTRLDQVRAKGHGLGLSIVRCIMEKLGGEVRVESEVGRGSVFSFALPSVPEAE